MKYVKSGLVLLSVLAIGVLVVGNSTKFEALSEKVSIGLSDTKASFFDSSDVYEEYLITEDRSIDMNKNSVLDDKEIATILARLNDERE